MIRPEQFAFLGSYQTRQRELLARFLGDVVEKKLSRDGCRLT